MEELLYEVRPYACILIGLAAIYSPETMGRACGLVLGAIGVYIWKMRKDYRSTQ